MITKKLIKRTRPFQPFLIASDNLLGLALPYYRHIKEKKKKYAETKIVDESGREEWQLEKSLCIASFMTRFAGLEALVNCVYNDFCRHSIDELPESIFQSSWRKLKKSLSKNAFCHWSLANRVYFLTALCTEPMVNAKAVFDAESKEWKMFEEVINIRHSFSHPTEVVGQVTATKVAPGEWIADDNFPENFWELTSVSKDHRTLEYEDVLRLNRTLDWIIEKLRSTMPLQLNDDYMTKEKWDLLDA